MKIKALVTVVGALLSVYSFGQKISTIDFDLIKSNITDSASTYFYPVLMDRMVKADTTLTKEEYKHLYYGNVFSENYRPYSRSANEEKFLELYSKGKFKKAIPYGEKVLTENPINTKISFKMLVCHTTLGDKKTAKTYANKYFSLLDAIYSSGDGRSIETAYVVIKVADEYELLADLKLSCTKQALIEDTDLLTISTQNQKEEPKITELYFNVSKPLDYLAQEFKKNKN